METTRNTLRAAMAALSAMAVALVAVILVSVHPVFASAAEGQVQGVAEGNISLSVPATTLPCALTADGTVITPDADKYAFVNTGSVAVDIASPEVKLSNGVHDVNMSAKAAVVATTDKNQFKKLFNESDKQIDWILNNQGQGEQTLMQGQSLCVKFGIDPLTYDKNANVIEQAATSSGCNIASVNYAYREKRMSAYAVFFDNGRTAKLYKGYDRPVKGEPYRGSTEPVFDFVDDIETNKAEVFGPYKNVLERVSVETEDEEIQPTTTKGWFHGCSKLAGVEGLSKLDTSKVTDMSEMFCSCRGLTSLDVSGFKTGNVTDMELMFAGCRGLTSLDVSGFNTSNVTDMNSMFQSCSGLTSLDLSKFDTAKVTNMGIMFWNCSKLTSLDLSKFKTGNVTIMNQMFNGCSGLASLDLSSFDTANVTNMGLMFNECSGLTSLKVSGFDTANVKYMGYMFYGCRGLASLDVSGFDTANVTDMGGMFNGCYRLASLDVSKFATGNVTSMSEMFYQCLGLTSLDVSKFDTANVTNMSRMFYRCRGLASLDLSSFDTANVTNIFGMFQVCSGLKQVTLKEGWSFKFADCSLPATMYVKDGDGSFAEYKGGFPTTKTDTYYTENGIKQAFAVVYDDGNGGRAAKLYNRAKVPAAGDVFEGDTVTEVITGIENKPGAFKDNGGTKLTAVAVVDDGIQPLTMKDWFNGCSKLADVQGLSKLDTSNVTDMYCMFYSCSKLASLDLSSFDTANVKKMDGMFNSCSGLESLDLSTSFDTANVTDMGAMFYGCSKLASLDLSSFNTANVTDMAYMFRGCSGLESLNLSGFDTSKVKNTSFMFGDCSGLKQVTLKEGWSFKFADCSLPATMYVKDGDGSFAEYKGGFPTTKTDTYYTENGIKQAFAVVYDDENGDRAAKLYNRAKVPAAGDVLEGDTVTEVITGIENMPGAFKDKSGGKKLTQVKVVDDGIQPTTTKGWFSGCSKLASVEGLSKLDTSKVTDMGYMFYNCWRLTSLQLSGFDTSSVTNMHSMFEGCSGLGSLQLSSFNTTNVTDMSYMFQGCSGLGSLQLSSFNTTNVTDMGFMFYNCWRLTSLQLSGFDTSSVTNMSYMFWGCRGLTLLDVSKFDTTNVMNMSYMFLACSGLTSLDLSGFDTRSVKNMYNMFYECSGLKNVTFPNDANSKANLQKALGDCGITLGSDEDANALSASDNMESYQCEEGVENRNFKPVEAEPLSGSAAAAATIAPSPNVSNAGKTEADSPGQSGGSESKEPSAEKADNCQPDSDGNLSSDKSGSSAHMK